MKNFYFRHPTLVNGSVAFILTMLAVFLGLWSRNPYFFLILFLAVALWVWDFIFPLRWIWACPSCGKKDEFKRNVYCTDCGSKMSLAKKAKAPTCPNGHAVYSFENFCPKCGTRIK